MQLAGLRCIAPIDSLSSVLQRKRQNGAAIDFGTVNKWRYWASSIVHAGKRSRIQLGKMPKKDAQSITTKIEQIVSKKPSRSSLDTDVAQWLGSLDDNDKLFQRLVALGLIEPRAKVAEAVPVQPEIRTIQSIVDRFTDVKRPMLAKRSIDKQEECLAVLVEYLGKDRDVASITLGEAEDFESFGKKRGFSDAHQRTHNRYAKQLFKYAVKHRWIVENPFCDLKSSSLAATSRHYVTPEDTASILESCPGFQWKLLVGLARYAGLRVPSEAFAITWDMVDWDKKALFIPSKKTRRYAESRVCPILPELMTLLEKGVGRCTRGRYHDPDAFSGKRPKEVPRYRQRGEVEALGGYVPDVTPIL